MDQAVERFKLERVDFVKIDTEGFEPYVIEGMRATLQQFRPTLYFEIHGLNKLQQQGDLDRAFKHIEPLGYQIWKLDAGLPRITRANISEYAGGGYIAYTNPSADLERTLQHWA